MVFWHLHIFKQFRAFGKPDKAMKRLNLLSVLLALAAIMTLSACAPGGSSWSGNAPMTSPAGLDDSAQMPPGDAASAAPGTAFSNLPPVKVAILLPLTGPHAALGQAMLQAAQIALFDIGYENFELMPRDTGAGPDAARQGAISAIEGGAKLLLGPVFAEDVRSVKSIAAQSGINVIAFSTDWTLAGGNTFIMGFLPFDQIDRVVNYAAAQNLGRIGVFAPQTDYGRAVVSAYRTVAARAGIPSANIATFTEGPAMSTALQNFIKPQQDESVYVQTTAPFDAILMPVGGNEALTISNLLNASGNTPLKLKRLGTGLFDDPAVTAEPSLQGAWFAAPSPRLREGFERGFINTYNYQPPRLATLAYDATALAAVLAQRGFAKSGQPDFNGAAITNPNGFSGIDGIFRFRADGTAERGLAILEIRNGRAMILDDAPQTFQRMTQ
jgi:ABC-type branched-subunit amino acid transport system substrate-binding protein